MLFCFIFNVTQRSLAHQMRYCSKILRAFWTLLFTSLPFDVHTISSFMFGLCWLRWAYWCLARTLHYSFGLYSMYLLCFGWTESCECSGHEVSSAASKVFQFCSASSGISRGECPRLQASAAPCNCAILHYLSLMLLAVQIHLGGCTSREPRHVLRSDVPNSSCHSLLPARVTFPATGMICLLPLCSHFCAL